MIELDSLFDESGLRWSRPQVMWWSLAALGLLVWFHHRSLSDFSKFQRRLSLVLRAVVVLLLLLALAGLMWLKPTQQRMIIVAIDQSGSIDEAASGVAAEFIDGLVDDLAQQAEGREDWELRFLPFGAVPMALVEEAPTSPLMQSESSIVDSGEPVVSQKSEELGTDIASAIRNAAASIPPSYVPSIVLLSDGNATSGDAVQAASTLGIPIATVALPQRSEPEVQVAAVNAPTQVRQGEPFFLEIVVNSNTKTSGYLDIYRGDIKIGDGQQEKVNIKKGETKFRIRQTVGAQRQVSFAARLRGLGESDSLLDNNEATALVSASGKPRVLMIDPDIDQTDSLRWALDEQDIEVEVRPPAGVPTGLAELQGYECLILSNVPATAMTMRQMDVIRTYVQDLGGGLIMLGGDQSFGLGGYYRSQLEEILPVRSNFEKEREKPSLAMMLVIDKSGSMGGEKIELAKDAARAAVELLGPRDSIGVIAFDGESYLISELRSASDKGFIIDEISTIDAGGGTNMYPAMDDAYQALASRSAKLKHCILLTDGISTPGDFEGLAGEMAASKMTVTTVAMGEGAGEELLEDIARIGGGRYYFCNDPQSVPQVFAKETVEASKSAINELPFLPQVVRPTQVLQGIDLELSPFLLGYVVTRPKPTSEFILASENGDPLLAWWRYGLGMSVAFTSDAKARWAAEWLTWPDFGPFWAQVIRHAMRKQDARGIAVEIQRNDDQMTVTMDTVDDDGEFINNRSTRLTFIDPGLKTNQVEMKQVAPGRYQAALGTTRRGSYQFDLAQQRGAGETVRQSRGVVVGYPDELRLLPTNEDFLRQIAAASGGTFGDSTTQIIQRDDRTARLNVPLWPYLLMAALILFVLDVGFRRIELPSGR